MENNTLILPDGSTFTLDESGFYKCPHNMYCHCRTPKCGRCGWHPKVAAARLAEIRETKGAGQRVVEIKTILWKPRIAWKQGGAGQ